MLKLLSILYIVTGAFGWRAKSLRAGSGGGGGVCVRKLTMGSFPNNELCAPKRAIKAIIAALSLGNSFDIPAAFGSTFTATDSSGITFSYNEDLGLEVSPKLVQTHSAEVFLKSSKIKGLSVGVTVDPVKISSVKEFATPQGLAERVVSVEKSKEGVFEANVISASESQTPVTQAVPAYVIEYSVDSSRGQNHYLVKTTVISSRLYVFTAQAKEDSFPSLAKRLSEVVESFRVVVEKQ